MTPIAREIARELGLPSVPLQDFLVHPLRKGAFVFRAHPTNADPVWFNSSEYSRFNLSEPRGTLYALRDPGTAMVGVLAGFSGRGMVAVQRHVFSFMVTRLAITQPYRLANISAGRARTFGVNSAITDRTGDQPMTQRWAQEFANAGFDGISYMHRFTTTPKSNAVALFGNSGRLPQHAPDSEAPELSPTKLAEAAGYVIAPVPTRAHLTLI
jgi:hypothetical protein